MDRSGFVGALRIGTLGALEVLGGVWWQGTREVCGLRDLIRGLGFQGAFVGFGRFDELWGLRLRSKMGLGVEAWGLRLRSKNHLRRQGSSCRCMADALFWGDSANITCAMLGKLRNQLHAGALKEDKLRVPHRGNTESNLVSG